MCRRRSRPNPVAAASSGHEPLRYLQRLSDMNDATQTPFGTYKLAPMSERLRQLAAKLPEGRLGRAGVSLIRRLIARRGDGAYDVEVFPTIKTRLYPATNTCEKRAFVGVQYFDPAERSFLDDAVAACRSNPFVFCDVGANVGLYGLSVVASGRRHGRRVSVLAVEPDPTTRRRHEVNVSFSGADACYIIEGCAAGAERGIGQIIAHENNRGEHHIAEYGGDAQGIEILPLLDIVKKHGHSRIDALKIDVEGMDYKVLEAFFATAPKSLYPTTLIVEVSKTDATPAVVTLCEKYGFAIEKRTRLNAILSRDGSKARMQ